MCYIALADQLSSHRHSTFIPWQHCGQGGYWISFQVTSLCNITTDRGVGIRPWHLQFFLELVLRPAVEHVCLAADYVKRLGELGGLVYYIFLWAECDGI